MNLNKPREQVLCVANYTINLPIIASSNDSGYTALIGGSYSHATGVVRDNISPPSISSTLTTTYSESPKRMGITWDISQVPKGMELKNAVLHFYTTKSHNKSIYYRYSDYTEGSSIPDHTPPDGMVAGGVNNGWGSIDLGVPKGNSVVLYAALARYDLSLYDEYGVLQTVLKIAEIWQINSQRNASNQPYIVLTYGDVPPEPPTSLYPSGTTEDSRNTIKFAWEHNNPSGAPQKSFKLQYSTDSGSSWVTITEITANQYYDMPALTLPATGTVLWRVQTTDIKDETSEYSTASFVLGTPPQKVPIPVAPISQYMDELKPITFEWLFTGGSVYDNQAKYDLQYSIDNGANWTTLTVTTSDTFNIVQPGVLSKGNVIWRVRTYNQFGDVSPYSDIKSYTVIGSPAIPLITEVSNNARPVIKWQTEEQHLYEIEISGLYATKPTPDTMAREFKMPIYLDNGEYTARIRVTNEYGLQSPWAERKFTILVEKPEKPSITAYNSVFKVTVRTESILPSFLYRDGESIGEMTSGIFEDYTGESDKEYSYFVRVIDENDSFADSDLVLGKCNLTSNTLALLSNPKDIIKLEYGLDDIPRKINKFSLDGTLQRYDGRTYPVAEFSEFKDEEKTVTFFFETKDEEKELIRVISSKETLIYRDIDGEIIIGCIFALDYSRTTLGYEVTFTITRTV